MFFKTLTGKMIALVIFCFITIFIIDTLINETVTKPVVKGHIQENIIQKSSRYALQIDLNFLIIEQSAWKIINDYQDHRLSETVLKSKMQHEMETNWIIRKSTLCIFKDGYNYLYVLTKDENGNVVKREQEYDTVYSRTKCYREAIKNQKPIWTESFFDEKLVYSHTIPFFENAEKKTVAGIYCVEIEPEWIYKQLRDFRINKDGRGIMQLKNQKVISNFIGDSVIVQYDNFSSMFPDFESTFDTIVIEDCSYLVQKFEKGSQKYRLFLVPISTVGGAVGCIYPDEIFVHSLSRIVFTRIIFTILIFIIFGLLLFYVLRATINPINLLTKEISKITSASGNQHLQMPFVTSNDEIGSLISSIKILIERWNINISDLEIADMQTNKMNEQLENVNKMLEEKVEKRTQLITKKSDQLQEAYNMIETLNEIGRQITSCLSIGDILQNLYEKINNLMRCDAFAIMTYNEESNALTGQFCIEKGEKLPYFEFDVDDENRYASWCFRHKSPIFINDDSMEYSKYISMRSVPKVGDISQSIIYLPIMHNDDVLGVISVQCYDKNAYSKIHLDMLKNLASYSSVALVNATAFEALQKLNDDLVRTQEQLILSERLASLGSLTAGIAHEIKNPLNFINNFAELSIELDADIDTLLANISLDDKNREELDDLLATLKSNLQKIIEHGMRADSIVKGMLLHSRGKAGDFQEVKFNSLVAEAVNLGYHGMRAQDASFNVKIEEDYDSNIQMMKVVPQNLSRVFLNMVNNACYTVHEKKLALNDKNYVPTISIKTENGKNSVKIIIRDNGKGIPKDQIDNIFTPFFTTKPTGKGTGLGLSLSYGIVVEEHGGSIHVNSEVNQFTEFVVEIPKDNKKTKNVKTK